MTCEGALFQPQISIIIPVYNGANYLREAIDSALAQTYRNFEIIVVDDGSTDGGDTRQIAQSYGSRLTYLWQENGGCGAALNTGIAAMSGDYFSWLSHDDVYAPEKLSRQIEILAALPDKDTIIYGNYDLINAKSKRYHSLRLETQGSPYQLDLPLYALTRGLINGCGLLISKRLFEQYGTFDPALKTTQDYDLWFRLFRRAPIKFDASTFVLSRVHDEQSSRTQSVLKVEGNALWTRFVDDVTPEEAIAMYGSHHRYLARTADFLEQTPYRDVAPLAREKASQVLAETLVTAVIPFKDRVEWTIEALESAQAQTHNALEIILVDDGTVEDIGAIASIVEADERIRYVRQEWQGTSAARNTGISMARGEYIAFLDSDDIWRADKIERQLRHMAEAGLVFCHTGYTCQDERNSTSTQVETHHFVGCVYPQIIASCPIATPTVMVRADIMKSNPFPSGIFVGEDIITWISIAREHNFGAMNERLASVRISKDTTCVSVEKSQRGVLNILSWVVGHPLHGNNHPQILKLIDLVRRYQLERENSPSPRGVSEERSQMDVLERAIFGWQLVRRGLESLRRAGVKVTWQRVRLWRQLRKR